jgi:tRNA A-37 threonylcarbamoyl transferase component Bud32
MAQSLDLYVCSRGQGELGSLALEQGLAKVHQVVRHLPNRRVVMRAEWQGQQVFIKAFLGGQAQRYAARDLAGVQVFQQHGILTPRLLHQEYSAAHQVSVLVFEQVNHAQSLSDYLLQCKPYQTLPVMTHLMAVLAQHHEAGLLQQDMHPENFLLQVHGQAMQIYSLDGDSVRRPHKLSRRAALHNLATLLCKLDVLLVDSLLSAALALYAQKRGWQPFSPSQTRSFKALMRRIRLQTMSDFADKKVFRNCSDVRVVCAPPFHLALANAYPVAPSAIPEAIQHAFVNPQYLKQGNTCTVLGGSLAHQPIVIKRYNIKNFWHGLSRGLRRSRAAYSWSNAHRMRWLGIATPAPVALLERKVLGWQCEAYYLAEWVEGESLRNIQETASLSVAADRLAQLFYRWHLVGISHGDCKADNFKYQQQQWWVLDLDSMRQHQNSALALRAHVRDLKRLFANWQASDRLYNVMLSAFVKRYQDSRPLQLAGLL